MTQEHKGLISIVTLVLILVGFIIFQTCNRKVDTTKDQTNFINSLADSIRTFKNKDSSERATISVLQSASASNFVQLKMRDMEIISLQSLVYEYKNKLKAGSSVTTATTTTVFTDTGKTIVTHTEYDSIPYGRLEYVYPNYKYSHSNQWIDYTMLMNKDTSKLSLKITNRYAVILGYDKKKPFVDVINYNPYSSTKILRSYQVSIPKPKVWGIGFSSGIGIGTGLKLQPYIGVGIQYNIIRF